MKYYAQTGVGYGVEEAKLIMRIQEGELIQCYDRNIKTWVEDTRMYQIYTGDIECELISEEKAEEIIKRLS